MEKLQEKILGLAALALAVSLGLNVLLGQRSGLLATRGAAFVMLVALAVVLAVFARARLGRLAAQEQRDEEIARREKPESALFEREEGEFEPFTMARSRRQFERFVVPAVAPLLAVLELLFAWNLRRALGLPAGPVAEAMLAGSFLVGQAFVLFLLSRYLLGLSRSPEHRLMRGPGVYLGVTCFAALAAGAACFVAGAAAPRADRVVVWIFIAALAVLAVENLLATLAWIYQPRRAEEPATSYETRLGALLTDPAAWVRNVAQALDYQFGFEVSQTWFYRFLQNALVPLLVFQLLVLYLLSCLVFLGPEEEGILERFGRPVDPARGHLHAGFHAKWPWPFETVRRFPARRLQRMHLGVADHDHDDAHQPRVMLWTVPHHEQEDLFLLASREEFEASDAEAAVPVNLLSMNVPVEYRITNIYQYAYNYAAPARLLEQAAYRSITREAVGRGLFDMVGEGQLDLTRVLQQRIQSEADRLQLGVRIEFVGLQGVHPPVPVADAFESVIGALEEKEAAVLAARAEANGVLPRAEAAGAARRAESEAYRVRRIELARAEAYRFEQRLKAHRLSPQVFRMDLYLRTLQEALADARKYIVSAAPSSEVITFDFEEKLRPDLFDLGPSPKKGSGR